MFTCRHESFTRDHPYIYINPDIHINTKNWELAWFNYQRSDLLLIEISLYAGYLALTLESQKLIISIFLTVGALSRFLTKF